jgi:hypothetical protein
MPIRANPQSPKLKFPSVISNSSLIRIAVLSAMTLTSMATSAETTARVADGKKWTQRKVRTVESLGPVAPVAKDQLSIYGGYKGAWQATASGFFRTEFRDQRWWFVDPLGYPFISVGMNTLNLRLLKNETEPAEPGGTEAKAGRTLDFMRQYSFNTIGRWSDVGSLNQAKNRMPYTTTNSFMAIYRNKRPASHGARGYVNQTIPVFDEAFVTFADEYAKRMVAHLKDDPWVLGHYTDNELPIRPDALKLYLALPPTDRGHQEAVRWLAARKQKPGKYSKEDNDAFVEHVAFTYYTVAASALRKHAPKHLVIGSRQHGRTLTKSLFRGSRPLDVVSVNYYHAWSPSSDSMTGWLQSSGRPFIQSEWYAKRSDLTEKATGAGFRVATQLDRGLFYQNHALGLMDHPGAIGWHWFKFSGTMDNEYVPYAELLDKMGELNQRVYPAMMPSKERSTRKPFASRLSAPAPGEPSDQNTFERWQAFHFPANERANPAVSGPEASAAGDGITNLFKYALLLDPKMKVDPVEIPRVTRDKGKAQLKYVERIMAEDLVYQVEISLDSEIWQSGGANVREIYRHSNRPEVDDVIVEFVPTDAVKHAYLRLQVEKKPISN